ncbi:putative glutathione S-transferase [Phytophthora cinnamomi]|uniref:putative glutathione S-transferase n=1 Tax=Phytophthora cinnamomi TaxID=4785 RepID=UPI00355AC658|nr:putative glutathione S-transferase [Phytophthora cinnamomi]
MAQPSIKLTYFDGKGRAELTRLIFNYGGVAFTDDRIARNDFPALKPTLPLGQVPVLEVNGTTYAQSMAIARYAAKLSGLYPSDPVKALKADMFSCSLGELVDAFINFVFKTADADEKARKQKVFVDETAPKFFTALEKLVEGKFVLGDQISYADVHLLDLVDNGIKWAIPTFTLEAFPKLAAVVANVTADPKIATYLAQQAQT